MTPIVVLHLGIGCCQDGLPDVTAQLWIEDSQIPVKYGGSLPVAEQLPELYQQWKALYEALNNPFGYRVSSADSFEFDSEPVTNVSSAEFRRLCTVLKDEIDRWLNSPGFRNIDQQLRTKLTPRESIQLIIETEDPLLQKLPWHLWQFFEHYPKAEMAISAQQYEQVHISQPATKRRMRILVILGHSDGINLQPDRSMLEEADAETVFLTEPKRSELNECLWDDKGWDILFFAGHSSSQAIDPTGRSTGQLFLNPTEQLSIDQLRHALKASISHGLKLAIFNSCDGMGLARALSDLNLPQMIVMREPVIDPVSHKFLRNFLRFFSRGEAFYTSVRQAREHLQGLEGEFPGASWLPVIFQNPTEAPITWSTDLAHSALKPTEPEKSTELWPTRRTAVSQPRPMITLGKLTLASLAVSLPILAVRALGFLQPLELSAYDRLMRSRPVESDALVDSRILVIEIDRGDTDEYGHPVKDGTLAAALEMLQQHQPITIGVDLHRYQVNEPGRESLLEQFNQSSDLITVCSFDSQDRKIMGHPPEFSSKQAQQQVGFSDLETDDGFHQGHPVMRRHLLSYDPRLGATSSVCSTSYSLSLNLALRFLREQNVQPLQPNEDKNWQLGSIVFSRLAKRTGGYQQLDGHSSQVMLNYRPNPRPARRASLRELMEGQLDESVIRDRIVIMGVTDPIGNDYRQTPYGELPGVWVHAHGVSQILSAVLDDRPLIWVLPQWGQWQWGDMLWILGWAMVGGLLIWRVRSIIVVGILGVVLIAGLRYICLMILMQGGWVPLVPTLLALCGTAGVLLVYRQGYLHIITTPLLSRLAWKRYP